VFCGDCLTQCEDGCRCAEEKCVRECECSPCECSQ
jgi:hypothetical protein